jgi:lipid-binding SYLF domain-containing protein
MVASLVMAMLVGSPLRAANREQKTVQAAVQVVHAWADIPLQGIPRALLHDAAAVAIFPHVLKAGLVVDGRFGRGVVLVHEPDGRWSDPLFVSLEGGGIGGQAGVEATELILVFKTQKSLNRALQGKLTLGSDASVAAGPVGRESEVAANGGLPAEIYSYSRSHGLFVGLSLEGAALKADNHANAAFYDIRGGHAQDVFARRAHPIPAVDALKAELARLW